ncbi:MAG: hypothetical protein KAR12_14135, partial [Methylococcales bacterium]|nr:hypothetical protein [Methylococcales bacterium]
QKFIQVFAIASLLCLSVSSNATSILNKLPTITDISSISNCKFLHDISIKSGYSKRNNWQRHTTRKALLKAEEFGATHLVISQVERIGVYNGKVHGKAYQC